MKSADLTIYNSRIAHSSQKDWKAENDCKKNRTVGLGLHRSVCRARLLPITTNKSRFIFPLARTLTVPYWFENTDNRQCMLMLRQIT